MMLRQNFHLLLFFQSITGQLSGRGLLMERSVDGQNFVILLYACMPLLQKIGLKIHLYYRKLLTLDQVKLLEAETSAGDFLKLNSSRGLIGLMAGPCVIFLCLLIICTCWQCYLASTTELPGTLQCSHNREDTKRLDIIGLTVLVDL